MQPIPVWKRKLLDDVVGSYKTCQTEEDFGGFFTTHRSQHSDDIEKRLSPANLASIGSNLGHSPSSQFETGPLDIPSSAAWVAESAAPTTPDAEFKKISSEFLSDHEKQANDIKAMTDELKKDPNPDAEDWRKKLEKKRDEVKRASDKIIDDTFNKAIATIETLPESHRAAAADLWTTMSTGLLAFWKQAWAAILSVVDTVVKWVVDMWVKIKEAFHTVVQTFAAAWDWIKHIVASMAAEPDAN
ncbi:uncharacterized protein B0H64DRAFT_248696 [Chaetomium fimeti]|uniref:Uncharacterized protein n=1 Tax=Chaetomium fimeti TaxID=1854472 RepID=A0AAE0LN69_9PEZI|nr:hypothetical protein B0H64DRAFT_248696 [Chaetomium fimeti]